MIPVFVGISWLSRSHSEICETLAAVTTFDDAMPEDADMRDIARCQYPRLVYDTECAICEM